MTTTTQNNLTSFLVVEIYPKPWMVEDSKNSLTPSMVEVQLLCCVDVSRLPFEAQLNLPSRSQGVTWSIYWCKFKYSCMTHCKQKMFGKCQIDGLFGYIESKIENEILLVGAKLN